MSNENIQQNMSQDTTNKLNILSVSDMTVFKDNPHLGYVYKKTEKLVSALYLLSNFISDKEPIKWQMREAGIDLLTQSLSLSDRLSSDQEKIYVSFVATGLKFLSLLEVSYVGGIISEMNYNILRFEFESLIQKVDQGGKESNKNNNTGLVFPEHFFTVPESQPVSTTAVISRPLNNQINKGQNNMVNKMSVKNIVPKPDKSSAVNRQDIIISLLKKDKELGIKDFALTIKDCSEKTIQRELATLVSKGQILKQGEKRWSRYSLK